MQSPKYDLDLVKASVRSWLEGGDAGWFSAPSCSVDYVIHIFSCDNASAEKIILDGLLRLDTENFSRRVSMWGDIADEYGLENYLAHNWYVKFMIGDDGLLEEISFHPCEKDMALANGNTLVSTINESVIPEWRKK